MKYLAFLRGINVGGNALIPMAELRDALAKCGLQNVKTYIQSGNVIFDSDISDKTKLGKIVHDCIKERFGHDVAVAIFTEKEWRSVITAAPEWWGKDTLWRHNILIAIPPYDMNELVHAIGELKLGIEAMLPGEGALYQSIAIASIGRGGTGSRLISNASYKKLTIRNFNTATKLLKFLESDD